MKSRSGAIRLGSAQIIPGKEYTLAELQKLVRNEDDAARVAWQGYVLQHDLLKDTYKLVHWTKSASGRDWGESNRPFGSPRMAHDPYAFSKPEPLVRRTPQQRRESLVNKWFEACKLAGTIPGLSDEQITDILGEEWKTGESQITYEVVERLAAAMLQRSENKQNRDDQHRVVRQGPTD